MSTFNQLIAGRAGAMAFVVQGLAERADRVLTGYRVRRDRARVESELSALSDRELLDIGLNRGDVGQRLHGYYAPGDFMFRHR